MARIEVSQDRPDYKDVRKMSNYMGKAQQFDNYHVKNYILV